MDEEGTRLPASVVRWERILRGIADEHGVWVAFASLVGFEGGKGFPGGSVVVSPAGEIVLRGPLFEEAVLTYDLDFDEITRARAEAPLLADLEVNLPHLIKNLGMPDRTSSPESLDHALLVTQTLGIQSVTIDITAAVDGYLSQVEQNGDGDPTRRGNVMARERMIVLFDLSAKYKALPIGTSNKSERLLGYFTWHADDTPPVNPLGDLFKTQVRALARHVGVPDVILRKPPTPDLVPGQTTEGDFGISYDKVDRILYYLIRGMKPAEVVRRGFTPEEVAKVAGRLESTHWKRRLPTVAMMSQTAIGEFYLRPVDY